jgi:DUF1680 family protein
MNQAPAHSLVALYAITGVRKYLDMARQIAREFELPPAGDYLRTALAGKEFWETPKPRWESLHPIMSLVELHYATGEAQYRQAFEHLWWSMCKGDRHNNGGFTSGERATGNPYDPAPIETCCTVAWMAMSVEMLRLTGNPIVADELELAMLNSGIGMMSASGRWVTYNTPMDGERRASAHDIVFQAKPGSPELNCCSVNGPRALGLLCEWAVMSRADGLALNYYGPGTVDTPWAKLAQVTDYPRTGKIAIVVKPKKSAFTLALRIPQWSKRTQARVNGQAVAATPGTYLELKRQWKAGDKIALELDFRPHYWAHDPIESDKDLERAGKPREFKRVASIYRGPILLAYDPRHNAADVERFPILDAETLKLRPVADPTWLKPWMLFETNGPRLRLCDFASAGAAGNTYRSWLPVRWPAPVESRFTAANTFRSARPEGRTRGHRARK